MKGGLVLLVIVCCIVLSPISASVCNSASSCSSCVDVTEQGQHVCGWCTDQDFVGPRCSSLMYLKENRCYNIENSSMEFRLQRYESLSSSESKRIAPQRIALNLKKKSGTSTEVVFSAMATTRWLALKVSYPKRKYRVTLISACRFRWRGSTGRGRCSRTRPGETIEFKMQISVLDCNDGNGRVSVSIPGYTQDNLNVQITSSCACECEREENQDRASQLCYGSGSLTCGICNCNQGYHGRNCECSGGEDNTCRSSMNSAPCSSNGQCVCGVCNCQRDYYGQYCECNDNSCDVFDGLLCGGSERGECRCGECQCKPGYTGPGCEFSLSTDNCIASSGVICNGQGLCEGNTCRCSGVYRGLTCEECPTCQTRCALLKPCVQCTVFSSGTYTEEYCYYQCRQYGIQTVDSLRQNEPGVRMCMFRDDDDCNFQFTYQFDEDGELVVEVKRQKECRVG